MGNQRFSIMPAAAVYDQSLSNGAKVTLMAICLFSDKEGWCWPSQTLLAEITGFKRPTINSHIKILNEAGYIVVEQRYHDKTGGQRSNMMQVKFDYHSQKVVPPLSSYADTPVSEGLHPLSVSDDSPCHSTLTHNDPNITSQKNVYIDTIHNQELPEEETPHFDDAIPKLVSALASVCSEAYGPGVNEDMYETTAQWCLANEVSCEDVKKFGDWWKKPDNGYYKGRPKLKSFQGEIQNMIDEPVRQVDDWLADVKVFK